MVAEKERLMGLETSEMVWVLVKTDMRQVVTEDRDQGTKNLEFSSFLLLPALSAGPSMQWLSYNCRQLSIQASCRGSKEQE